MSVQYCSFLSIKQMLTNEQIEDILKIDAQRWLSYEHDDYYGQIIESVCSPFFAMSEINFNSTNDIDKINKYDKDGYWPIYLSIESNNIANINNLLISLVIAKYIYKKWKIETHSTENVGGNYIDFTYNNIGFITTPRFKEYIGHQHLHPISRDNLVLNYHKNQYEGVNYIFKDINGFNKISSYETRNTNDLIIHILQKGNGDVIRSSNCHGNPKHYLAQKPLNNPRLIEFECEGPAQRFIEYSNWQYQLTVSSIVPQITETYRADKIWYDVILIDIIKKAYYSEDEIIVTSSTGEIILYMKNKELVIEIKWQDYFSIFPIIPKDYKVEDITNI